MSRLAGKVAIVTGGSRGMGEATVRMLVEQGAKVLIGDVLDEAGKALGLAGVNRNGIPRAQHRERAVPDRLTQYGKPGGWSTCGYPPPGSKLFHLADSGQ